jgi:hypothetical protein
MGVVGLDITSSRVDYEYVVSHILISVDCICKLQDDFSLM